MKRLLVTTLIIGFAVTLVVGALHATRITAGLETVAAQLVSDYVDAKRGIGEKWQYIIVLLIALGVSWRWSLYGVFFQPIPSVLALVFALAIAETWSTFLLRHRSHLMRTFFADRVSNKTFRALSDSTSSFNPEAKAYDVAAVVCDLGTNIGFAEHPEPAPFAEAKSEFIREAAAQLTKEGAYLHAADGEGVVAFFGFPLPNGEHAQKAVRVVLEIMKNFRVGRERNDEIPGNIRAGISSGV